MTAFEEMGMLPELGRAVEDLDWTLPTDVQAEAIPAVLGGGDVLMAAETGSGKTGAFCLPVLQIVWEAMKDQQLGKTSKTRDVPIKEVDWTLNMFDRGSAMAIQPDGLLCQSRHPTEWHGSRCTFGVAGKGKYYYEATVTDDGLCRIGWSTPAASLDLGTDRQGFGFGGTGKKSFGKQFDDYGETFTLHDTIGCFINLDKKEITYSKNGKVFPKAFDIPRDLHNSAFFPAVVIKNAEISFNFGATPFKHPPTDGYVGVNAAPEDNVVKSTMSGGPAPSAAPKKNAPMCIIIEPTRELAEQTHAQIDNFKKYLESPNIRNVLVIGSVPARDQQTEISKGVDIITGTPGRLEDFISTGTLDLSQVRFFVLDEADGLLSGGYISLIERMHRQIPKVTHDGKRLQMIVCSATLHNKDVKKLADKMMHFPQWVDLKGQDSVPDTVHHVVVPIDPKTDRRWMRLKQHVMVGFNERFFWSFFFVDEVTDGIHARDDLRPGSDAPETLSEAVKILKGEYVLQAIRQHKMDRCLIFCRTKVDCDNLESYLVQTSKGMSIGL
uniref:ATP-dependent RNA helicase n=1 Tax=Plectus sambesii TaxID=2011161 RepID=A0A914WY60_9BILA